MANYGVRNQGGTAAIINKSTHETLVSYSPVVFRDDFLGDSIGALWTAIDVSSAGDTTPLLAADAANGVLRLPLDATSEAQESGVTWGDQRPLVLNQKLIFECRMALQTLPTLLSEMVWGLASDKNSAADSVATNIWFKADGSGAIVAESDDGTTDNDDKSTGVTVTAGLMKTYRIDCTDPTDIRFYIDGEPVATATTFSANATPTVALQPYVHVAKASGAGLGVVDVDYVHIQQERS